MLSVKSLLKKFYLSFFIKPIDLYFYLKNLRDIKKIEKEFAFIRLDLLGDNFIFFPFLLKYKKLYPNSTWIINSNLLPLYSMLDLNTIPVENRKFRLNPFYRFKILKKINKKFYYSAINLSPHRSHIEGDDILKLIKSKNKTCYGNDYILGNVHRNNICNHVINFNYQEKDKDKKYIHIYLHEKNFFENLTNEKIRLNTQEFYSKSFQLLRDKLNSIYKKEDTKYIVILTDASIEYRCYPVEKWQYILNKIPSNVKIVQLGLRKFPLKHPNLVDLTAKTTLKEAMFIVMNSSLVIGNETGLTHLAYLSGVPTVCILGGGHFGRFLPWPEFDDVVKCVYKPMDCFQCSWNCKYVNLKNNETPPCISEIEPDNVIATIENLNSIYGFF